MTLTKKRPIELHSGKRVSSIRNDGSLYIVETETGDSYLTHSVVIAIGKSGDPKG